MTSALQALAAKQIEVETRKQQSHEQKSGRKHYEFPYNYMYFEELLPESFSTEL